MKHLILAATVLAASALTAAPTAVAADVAVSITSGAPNFYGRIDIGNFPQPQVIYAQPVIIQRSPQYVAAPLYLRVPPGHMKKWSKHCAAYNACGQQVYFVRDEWYTNVYAPHERERHEHEHGNGNGNGNGKGHDRDDDHGKGNGKGHGNGNGKGHGKD